MLVQNVAISPSARLAVTLCVTHLAAASLVWIVPLPVFAQGALTLAIAFSLIYFLARDATLHAASAIVALELKDGGGIAFRTRDGSWVESELSDSSYVSPGLTIVVLRPRGRGRTRRAIILADSVEARDFRRLRMWMRWKSEGGEPASPPEC